MTQAIPIHIGRFPKSYAFLQGALPAVSEDAAIWLPLLANSGLNQVEASAAIDWGTPPWVFASPLSTSQWALFNSNNPGRIEVSADVLARFENAASDPAAQRFILAKVLHELCHWGCFRKQIQEVGEVGEKFEREAFGHHLSPWWVSVLEATATAPAASSVDGGVFTDPKIRAAACRQLLSGIGHVPGRMQDPLHKCFGGEDVSEPLPRGIRNNNPGNLRRSADAWLGLARPDQMTDFQQRESDFFVFREPEWGMRAMISLLRTYKRKHGLATPRAIIARYAPSSDNNDVASYASALAAALGIGIDDPTNVEDPETAIRMIRAMIRHENGTKILYSDIQYRTALELL